MSGRGSRSPVPPWAEEGDERFAHDTGDPLVDAWLEGLRDAYYLAKGERIGELRGRRVKLLDDRGMHPYSVAWGRVYALEALRPELQSARLSDPPVDPVQLRRVAQRDAEGAFYSAIQNDGVGVWR